MTLKTGVLLINLGTPDSPKTGDVRRYLSQFLNDPRVIDIPWLSRKLLVNGIIVPFRAPRSAKVYSELWTGEGSPLLYYSETMARLLQEELGDAYKVELAMRYQNPSLPSVLSRMEKAGYQKIILLPLFPQYASASTGSALEEAMRIIHKWWVIPEVVAISQYYDHPLFLDAFAARGKLYNIDEYDHVIFSYHGLPVRQVDKAHVNGRCSDQCERELNNENQFCYRATCYATTRGLVQRLGIPADKYSVSFQSRLNDRWLKPFSDKLIAELAKKGKKSLLVFSPAFTADCLETTVEIGREYDELFRENGGQHLQLVESLNDHPIWIETLKDLVLKKAGPSYL